MAIASLFGKAPAQDAARQLYETIVEQARRPDFYRACAVPDTVDGRFDLIALHVFLVLRRLKVAEDRESRDLGQAVFDIFVQDMDASLREMGAGDLGVGKRVKAMIRGLYGRIAAYDAALDGDSETLEQALERNLYGTASPLPEDLGRMADYVRRETAALGAAAEADLALGRLNFGPAPV